MRVRFENIPKLSFINTLGNIGGLVIVFANLVMTHERILTLLLSVLFLNDVDRCFFAKVILVLRRNFLESITN